jgi:membrane protease YdiL (CAAX protease family)
LLAGHPVKAFIALAFLLSFGVGFAAMWLLGMHGWGPDSLVGTFLAPIFVVIGPALAAIAIVRATGGQGAVRAWLLADLRRTRFAWWWALVPPLALVIVIAGYLAAGESWPLLREVLADNWLALLAFYAFHIIFIGLLEELGWRGWLLPKAMEKLSPFLATALVTAVWAAWHLPKLISSGPAALIFLAALLAYSFLLTFGATFLRGGVALAALAHGSFNAPVYFFDTRLASHLGLEAFGWATLCYAAIALIAIACVRRWWFARGRPGQGR